MVGGSRAAQMWGGTPCFGRWPKNVGRDSLPNLVDPLVWPETPRSGGQQQPTTFEVLVSAELGQVSVKDREVDTLLDARTPTVLSRLAVEEVSAATGQGRTQLRNVLLGRVLRDLPSGPLMVRPEVRLLALPPNPGQVGDRRANWPDDLIPEGVAFRNNSSMG